MKQRFLNELTANIIGYFASESIGNSGEDFANIFDILETRLLFLPKSDDELSEEDYQ